MMNPTVVEALYSATYVEDYIDACENLPDDVQRQLSRMRELDSTCQGYMRDADVHMKNLMELLDAEDSESVQREINSVSWRLQQLLISAQEVGDDKLQIVQQIQDFVDNKARQLDLDKKNLELGKDSDGQEVKLEVKHEPPERSTIIKRARRARHEVFVPSILGPSTLAATRFTSDDPKIDNGRRDVYRTSILEIPTASIEVPSIKVESIIKSEPSATNASPTKHCAAVAATSTTTSVSHSLEKSSNSAVVASSSTASERTATASSSNAAVSIKQEKHKTEKKQAEIVEKKKYKKRKSKQTDNSPPNIPIDPDEPTYCLCDQVSYGEMIGCDNDLCPIEWFHFSCVTLTTKPKGKWYCPKCRGDRPNVMKPKAIFLKELEKYNREKEEKA